MSTPHPTALAEAASQLLEDLQALPPHALEQQPLPDVALLAAIVHPRHCIAPTSVRRKLCEWIVVHQQRALIAGDRAGYLQWFTCDVLFEDSSGPPCRGVTAVGNFIDRMMASYETAKLDWYKLSSYPKYVDDADQWWRVRVAMTFQMEVTPIGGSPLKIEGVDVFDFDASLRIERLTSFYPLST
jgi:hypothetical protein